MSRDMGAASGTRATRRASYGQFDPGLDSYLLVDLCVRPGGIQTGPFGSQLHERDYVAAGTPIITVEHLGENFISHDRVPRVCDGDRLRLSKYLLQTGDIVFSRVGSVDRRALVRSAEDGWLFSGRCLRVRPNPELVDSLYLSYYFGLPSFKAYVRAVAVGATMPSLNTEILCNMSIRLPTLSEQRAIAEVLGALDDKIEANIHMATIAEALAQAYATKWLTGNDAPLTTLEDVADISKGASYRSVDLASGDGWLVSLKCAGRDGAFQPEGLKPFSGAAKDSQVVGQGDIVVAQTDLTQRGSVIGRPYRVDPRGRAGRLVASLDFAVVRPRDGLTREVLFAVLSQQEFRDHALGFCNGTTVLHMNSRALPSYEFPLPKAEVIRTLTAAMGPILKHADSVRREGVAVSSLRDALLPRLLSGEIRVPQAEPYIEAAL